MAAGTFELLGPCLEERGQALHAVEGAIICHVSVPIELVEQEGLPCSAVTFSRRAGSMSATSSP